MNPPPAAGSPIPARMTRPFRALLLLVLLAGCMPISPAGYVARHADELQTPWRADGAEQVFRVQVGQTALDIARSLARADIIGDSRLFASYVETEGLDRRLEAGTYYLSAAMTIPELAQALQHGLGFGRRLTVGEGLRREETAARLESAGLGSRSRYLKLSSQPDSLAEWRRLYPFLPKDRMHSLEGYLFPATYSLEEAPDLAQVLVSQQLAAFQSHLWPAYEQSPNPFSLTLHEAVILASIVQREAGLAAEMPRIAGVLLNRLAIDMPLQVDSTALFANGYNVQTQSWWLHDMDAPQVRLRESPYNTYTVAGLPAGPIASPGQAAFQAVLDPERHDFLFFVARSDGSRRHLFAETFEEHVRNAQLVRR